MGVDALLLLAPMQSCRRRRLGFDAVTADVDLAAAVGSAVVGYVVVKKLVRFLCNMSDTKKLVYPCTYLG